MNDIYSGVICLKYIISLIFLFLGLYLAILSLRYSFIKIKDILIESFQSIRKKVDKLLKIKYKKVIERSISYVKRVKISIIHKKITSYFEKMRLTESIFFLNFSIMILSIYLRVFMPEWSALINILTFIFLCSSFIFCAYVIVERRNQESRDYKVMRLFSLYAVIFIIGFASLYILIVLSKNNIRLRAIIVSLSVFNIVTGYCFYIATDYFNNKLIMVIITSSIYISIILFGSFVLGLYYYQTFRIDVEQVKSFTNNSQYWELSKRFIKIGLKTFYNYPDDNIICKVSVAQFLIGKIIDLFTLGYIFSRATGSKEGKLNKNKNRIEEVESIQEIAAAKNNNQVSAPKRNDNVKRKRHKK